VQAIKEIADRIDGKVPTPMVGDDEHPPVKQITKIERVFIDPPKREAQ
jgi:hypothetical protein